ncbi:hypothetical protein OEZ85_007770 [Tetradesmus obliquus]|uniref:Hedgehog protein Hint domain-containing protein n=1 Tax=Tetradesmus obliquus TaxID=3088 RepID=A0ABY8TLF1_TETOB|nr:hypothetical protein OEZ85_007770 [Tetradesmus obliquus]
MPSYGALLLALVAASAAAAAAAQGSQGRSFYSKVASCVAQEVKKEAIGRVAGAVGIAQATGSSPAQDSVDFYTVGFTPGLGCFLTSIITRPQRYAEDPSPGTPAQPPKYDVGAIIAVSPTVSAVTANTFTCKFTKASAAFSPAQARNLAKHSNVGDLNNTNAVFQLPAKLTGLKDKLRCTYVLYDRTGYNYTRGQSCVPTSDPAMPLNCTEAPVFDAPSIQWHFDKDNKPALTSAAAGALSVTCKVNNALLGREDTALFAGPNDGACFPAAARLITPAGPKPIAQLVVGDKVLAVDASTGTAVFDDVYLMPHRDAGTAAAYLNIRATPVRAAGSSKVLTLSPMHHVPTACGATRQQQCLKHTREVAVGDLVWLLQGQQAVLARVDEVTASTEQGMYSPWTLSGSIVVEGFAASTHTAWPGEAQLLQLLPRKHVMPAQHLLAQAHHALQAPLRAVYRALGKSPLALLNNMIFSAMQAVNAPSDELAAAVRVAAQATTAA